MILKNKEIFEILNSIQALSKQKISANLAWKILKIKNKLDPIMHDYALKSVELKKMFSLKDENGKIVTSTQKNGVVLPVVDPNKAKQLNEKIIEKLNEENEIEVELLSIDDFEKIEVSIDLLKYFEKIIGE